MEGAVHVSGIPEFVRDNPSICAACKGVKHLCGKSPCPLLKMVAESLGSVPASSGSVSAMSPPSAFVGEYGYPFVGAGPLIPGAGSEVSPEDPASWLSMDFPRLVQMRVGLMRTSRRVFVGSPFGDTELEKTQELAMSYTSVGAELRIGKLVSRAPSFSFYSPPMGPTASLERILSVENPHVPRVTEKVVYDRDLKASEALVELWKTGLNEHYIHRLLSLGMLGVSTRRKLVPTRWSITAVDDTASKALLTRVRNMPLLSEYLTGSFYALGNRFSVLLLPEEWRFEFLESWLPFTGRVDDGSGTVPSDFEEFEGRTTYASNTAGAYYAARLAVAQKLADMKRQSGAIVFMEVDSGWIAPLGVWRVREGVRAALTRLERHDSMDAALTKVVTGFQTQRPTWLRSSVILTRKRKTIPLDRFLYRHYETET
ncbi:MAG: hypothetical protein QXI37_02545 [Thermoprotei archaeon]